MASAAEIIHDVETSYAGYSAAFHRDDAAGIVRYISAPYAAITAGNAPSFSDTPEKVLKQFENSLAGMRARGWARTDYKIAHIWPLSDKHALLMSDIVRYKTDGSVMETGRYCYWFRRADPVWRMCAITDVQAPFLGPGDFPRAGGGKADKAAEIARDVETSFQDYNAAFHRGDIPGIVKYITAPYAMIIAGNVPRFAETPEKVAEQYRGTLSTMKTNGWARSDLKVTRVWPMSEKHAIALADIVRYRADNSVLETLRFFYTFRRVPPVWQLCSATDVQPAFLGPGDIPRP